MVWFLISLFAVQTPAAGVDALALERMAATERAFAAATAEVGVRDGFLAFFAPDAIQIRAGRNGTSATVRPARPALAEAALSPLPLTTVLSWAPYTGHVSSDGTFGWLTGAFVGRDKKTGEVGNQGAYFSVWKRQRDGTWRVWLDEGAALPEVWTDATPLRPAPEPDAGLAGQPNENLTSVERVIAAGGEPWRERLAAEMRLHRSGRMPFVGRSAVEAWAGETWTTVKYTVLRTQVAASNDLGVTLGGYDATGPDGAEHGTWVRVWKRDAAGRWRIVFETSTAAPR